jgi:hypothetical protein
MLGTELFGRRKLILALVLTMTSLHIDNRQLQGGGCKSVPYPLYQNRLAQFEFGIRHEHLPDREKGKRHSRSFFERKLGWHQKAVAGLNAHVLGIRVAFPLSHQAQAGAQVLAIGQTKFTNVAAGGG